MHSFSITTATAILAALAIAAPLEERTAAYQAPKGRGTFELEVIATDGNIGYSGQWLDPYHTGAGFNALVLVNDQTEAQSFNFSAKTGDLTAYLPDYTYYLELSLGDLFAPPKGYSFVGLNNGFGTPGRNFSFSTPGNYLQFPTAEKGDNFAVCEAVIYDEGDYIPTLLYRAPGAKKNSTCADVKVKAVF